MFRTDPAEKFADRRDAGRCLARAVIRFRSCDPLVLALPRGGVPVAFEVAKALHAPLDLFFVRKIGAPGNPELGLGAVADGAAPQLVLNETFMRLINPPPGYIEAETQRQLREIAERRRAYLGNRTPLPVAGRTVLVVDDGAATGGTARAALQALRRAGAERIVLALPVAAPETLPSFRREADDLICLRAPEPFEAVGLHYADFAQTSDAEVIGLLREAATPHHAAS